MSLPQHLRAEYGRKASPPRLGPWWRPAQLTQRPGVTCVSRSRPDKCTDKGAFGGDETVSCAPHLLRSLSIHH